MFNDLLNSVSVNEFIQRFLTEYNKNSSIIDDCNKIISNLSRENYTKIYFPSDYFFWELYFDFVRINIKNGEKLYNERKFDRIISECKMIITNNTLYHKLKDICDNSYSDFNATLYFIETFKPTSRYNYDVITMNELVILLKENDNDDSKYCLDIVERFINDISAI